MSKLQGVLAWIRTVAAAAKGEFRVSPVDGLARIYTTAEQILEHQGNKGQASGYAPLTASSLVDFSYLGTGGGGSTKFLREDNTWQTAPGGGGTLDHAALTSNLAWGTSGHTGTASRLAAFDGSGNAAYQQVGVDIQAYDAGLASLTSADASAGLPYVSAANTWASATYASMLSVVGGAWKVIGLRETGGPTDLTLASIPDGYFLKRSGSTVVGVAGTAVSGYYGDPFSALMGSGAKGNVTFDGTTSVTGFSLASRVYTCTANDSYEYAALTLDTTGGDITIVMKGVPLRAITVTGSGSGTVYLDFSGGNASGSAGGANASALSGAPWRGGSSGANGRTTTGNGAVGGALVSGIALGGEGGHGGGTAANNGGNSGAITRPYDGIYGSLWGLLTTLVLWENSTSTPTAYHPSGGVGGGAGAATITSGSWSSGGGGGAAGGYYCGFGAVDLGLVTLAIRVNGGTGAAGSGSGVGNVGGGQGGAGGGLLFAARSITGTIQLKAEGGAGGNGAGTNGAGGDGGFGGRIFAVYGTGTAPTTSVAGGAKGTDIGSPTTPAVDGTAGTAILSQL